MKSILICFCLHFTIQSVSFAQTDTIPPTVSTFNKSRSTSAIYLQLGGAGFFGSVVYDRRLVKKTGGPGFAVGIGGIPGGSASALTVPLSLNYTIGEGKHFMELAGGTTYATGEIDFIVRKSGEFFFHHISIGYRYQPANGGFFFRGGLCPLFIPDENNTILPYLGLGVRF